MSPISTCPCSASPTAWADTTPAKSPRALAIDAITAFIRRSAGDTDFSWPYGIDRNLSYDANRLRTAIHLANRRIFRTAENNDDYNGMGTTIVGALVNGDRMAIAHVGDSRLYLVRRGPLRQLTARRLVGCDDPRP